MNLKLKIKRAIPPFVLNNLLLAFPFLYRTKLVNYETNLLENDGIAELLTLLETVLNVEGNIIECGSSRCGTIDSSFSKVTQTNVPIPYI